MHWTSKIMATIVSSTILRKMPQSRYQVQRLYIWPHPHALRVTDTVLHYNHTIQCDSYQEVAMMAEWDDTRWSNWLAAGLLISPDGE